jgi:integrase
MAITAAELERDIRALPAGTLLKRLNVGDRLFLEVRKPVKGAGGASWVLRYSYAGKKQSLGLGRYDPKATRGEGAKTLAQARAAAAEKLAEIDKGIQPVKAARERVAKDVADRAARAAVGVRTVRKAVEQWHGSTMGKLTSPKYAGQRLRRLEEYLGHIGDKPVALLTVADVADTLTALGASGRAETFRRSSADLEKSIDWAAAQGWFDGINPVTRARKGLDKPEKVGRRAFKADRLPDYAKALSEAMVGLPYPVTGHLLRMLTLTGARTREIRELRWSEVEGLDTNKPMLHIPASRMKQRKPWSVPLSAQAVQILRDLQGWQVVVRAGLQGVTDGFVFTRLDGNYQGRLCSENAVNDLLKVMGWHGELVGHGLRKVFSTVAHASWPYLGINRTEAIEFSLAHVHADKIRGTYDQNDFMDQRRALMQWWADHLDRVRQPQADNVMPMRAGQR